MAIDFNKFISKPEAKKSGIDFSKFLPKDFIAPESPEVRKVGLPEHLGGGTYLTAGAGTLIRTPRSYAGLPTRQQEERDHVISVALGGTSDKENLQYLKTTDEGRQEGKVSVEQLAINEYLNGNISLPEARARIAHKQQLIKGLIPPQGVKANLLEGFKDIFKHPVESLKKAIEINPQTAQAVGDLKGLGKMNIEEGLVKNTVKDFVNSLVDTSSDTIIRLSNLFPKAGTKLGVLPTETAEGKGGRTGLALKAGVGLVSTALSPITAAFEASKNLPIIGDIASLINVPLAISGDILTNLSNEGLNALVETGKMDKETAENIREGINEVASLTAQIVVAGKMFKGKERVKVKEKLEKKYGKKDAETILKKAEQRATIELEAKVKPKIDFEKFIEKPKEVKKPTKVEKFDAKAEVTPEITRKAEQLGDPVLQVGKNKVAIELPKLNEVQRAKLFDEVGTIKDFKKQPIHLSQRRILDTDVGKGLEVIKLKEAVTRFPEIKKLVEDLQIKRVIEKPIEYKPIIEPIRPSGNAVASIAKSIETKAIEKGLIEGGFDSLASFERTTLKDQARMSKELFKDFEKTRRVIRAEEPLPSGLKGISIVETMERVIKRTKDPEKAAELSYELANSPLAEGVSLAAQELSLTRGRQPDSATARSQRVKKAREKKAKKDLTKKKQIKKDIKKETEKVNLSKSDLKWDNFLDKIKC